MRQPAGKPNHVGTVIGDRYEVVGVLGDGGTATVYEAVDQRLGHHVALKVLHHQHPTAARRMEREARVAASLRHPNVCLVTDFGHLDPKTPWLVMELLVGQSLGALLRERRTLTAEETLDIAKQVLSVLYVAHRANVVHRDIKPDNLFLAEVPGRSPLVKVLDFGIASADVEEGLTMRGDLLGTPAYMSPEQVVGDHVDGRSDIYSCAIVMYECLTGHPPYEAPSKKAVMDKIIRGGALSIGSLRPELPEGIARAIDEAMRVERELRFSTALEMIDVLSGRGEVAAGNWEAETEKFADQNPIQPSPKVKPPLPVPPPELERLEIRFEDATQRFLPPLNPAKRRR